MEVLYSLRGHVPTPRPALTGLRGGCHDEHEATAGVDRPLAPSMCGGGFEGIATIFLRYEHIFRSGDSQILDKKSTLQLLVLLSP